jgi:hypothetical protein
MIDLQLSDDGRPDEAIEPFAAASVVEDGEGLWSYTFAYLPAGDYTLAFSCDAQNDDPELFDGVTLPFPVDQIIERSAQTSGINCNFPIDKEGEECD